MPSIELVGSRQKLKLLPLLRHPGAWLSGVRRSLKLKDANLGDGFLGKVRPRPLNRRSDSKSYFLAANRLFSQIGPVGGLGGIEI